MSLSLITDYNENDDTVEITKNGEVNLKQRPQ